MTTPFYSGSVAYSGADPHVARSWAAAVNRYWLGKAGNMVELPSPSTDYTPSVSQGEVEHGLMGGGSAVTRLGPKLRRWSLPFTHLTERDFQLVNGFYLRRVAGVGPWAFLPAEDVNRLSPAQSVCGLDDGAATGWAVSVGTVTYDSTIVPAVAPCGVLRWHGAGSGSLLTAGQIITGAVAADTSKGLPYVAAMPLSLSLYAKVASGSPSVKLRANGLDTSNAAVTSSDGSATTLSTSWQRLTLSLAAGDLTTSAWAVLTLVCNTASAVDILVSCPQLETNTAVSSWGAGAGVPRVVWPTAAGDRAVDVFASSTVTMTLAETRAP